MTKRVLTVGNCNFDNSTLAELLKKDFQADMDTAHAQAEAMEKIGGNEYALVIVNRVFDRNGDEGLALVKAIKNDAALAATPVMLLSNYATAQEQAATAGAEPGFGKSELQASETREKLAAFLAD